MNAGLFLDHYTLSGFSLAPIRPEDAKTIADEMVRMNPWRFLNYSTAALESYLSATDLALYRYVVTIDEGIAGVVAVRYPWLRGAYLELIGLFPGHQQKGFGAAILHWLERETEARAANLWVLVSACNDGARRFYLRQGFQEIGPIEALVSTKSTELLLRKVLRKLV